MVKQYTFSTNRIWRRQRLNQAQPLRQNQRFLDPVCTQKPRNLKLKCLKITLNRTEGRENKLIFSKFVY